jgi:hypothetical protein
MMTSSAKHPYKATETKYKGGAKEMYVTYDLTQKTAAGRRVAYPKVKRVYIAGTVKAWRVGTFEKRTGRKVWGVKVDYGQSRAAYERQGYQATRAGKPYKVAPAKVVSGRSSFSKVIEVPKEAQHVQFHKGKLPRKYQDALQAVR